MARFSVEAKGDYAQTIKSLQKLANLRLQQRLEKFGREGVAALSAATPVDSSLTASSWSYKIVGSKGGHTIVWTNSHIVDGTPVAILIQYGHGTGTGGYVKGRDYINPAIRPVFDRLADDVWKAVTSA